METRGILVVFRDFRLYLRGSLRLKNSWVTGHASRSWQVCNDTSFVEIGSQITTLEPGRADLSFSARWIWPFDFVVGHRMMCLHDPISGPPWLVRPSFRALASLFVNRFRQMRCRWTCHDLEACPVPREFLSLKLPLRYRQKSLKTTKMPLVSTEWLRNRWSQRSENTTFLLHRFLVYIFGNKCLTCISYGFWEIRQNVKFCQCRTYKICHAKP